MIIHPGPDQANQTNIEHCGPLVRNSGFGGLISHVFVTTSTSQKKVKMLGVANQNLFLKNFFIL